MGMPSMPQLIVILVIILLLFGAKKIPDLAKGLGSGIKNFKKAVNEDDETDKETIEQTKEIKEEPKKTKTSAKKS